MISLPDLPYPYDALSPTLSEDTLHFHHDKHHRKYVEQTNKLAAEHGLDDAATLEEIILKAREQGWTKLTQNAEQAWNHAFFWTAMTANAKPAPSVFAGLKAEFLKQGAAHFGSGWAWIVADGGELAVITTHDSADLVGDGRTPLIVCDLWEHAYYLDYQNDRAAFLEAWWDSVVNWDFAEQQLKAAEARNGRWEFAMAA